MITDKHQYLKPFRILLAFVVIWFTFTAILPGCERVLLVDMGQRDKAIYMIWLEALSEYWDKQARER